MTVIKCTRRKRVGQNDDETAMEYLRRVVEWCGHERESMLDQLPSVDAVCDFFDLWRAYGTDFWDGVLECISDGESAGPAMAFIAKHKLGKAWKDDVKDAIKNQELPCKP